MHLCQKMLINFGLSRSRSGVGDDLGEFYGLQVEPLLAP